MDIWAGEQGPGHAAESPAVPALRLGSIFIGACDTKVLSEQAPTASSSSHLVSPISAHMQHVKTGKMPICKKCC